MYCFPAYKNQPGTITKEYRNAMLVSYVAALQRLKKHGPILQNVVTPRQSKRPYVVLYNAHNAFPKIREKKK